MFDIHDFVCLYIVNLIFKHLRFHEAQIYFCGLAKMPCGQIGSALEALLANFGQALVCSVCEMCLQKGSEILN